MKFINASQETEELHKTHAIFWENNIIDETPKALHIVYIRWDGTRFTGWVPKSRTLALSMQDHKNPNEPRTKFFIPKFFTRHD
jgi:hypothetical protein